MQKRRTTIELGVVYETNYEQLARIQAILKEIVGSVNSTEFIRASFVEFADFSLNFDSLLNLLQSSFPLSLRP